MNGFGVTRGKVLSRSQVHFSDAPVSLAEKQRCGQKVTAVQVETDPISGDILEIRIRCACGDETVLECHYDGAPAQ